VGIKLTALLFLKLQPQEPDSNLQIPSLGEGLEAAVVSLLDVVGETAAGKLPARQVISQTLTAYPFITATGIRAVAIIHILIFITFHNQTFLFQITK
jgi:hypothetical protein